MTEIGIGMILLVLPIWAIVYAIKKRRGEVGENDAPFMLQVVYIAMALWVLIAICGNCSL